MDVIECTNRENYITDTHVHALSGMDDGARTEAESIEMIQSEYNQGVRSIFLTSHSWGVDGDVEYYKEKMESLRMKVSKLMPDLKLYEGCEMHIQKWSADRTVEELKAGKILTMNHTKYVLVEFDNSSDGIKGADTCIDKVLAAGYIPILAHIERYAAFMDSSVQIRVWKEKGCLVQINLYSVEEEKKELIKNRVRELISERMVDFVGTDAHRMNHRAPKLTIGIKALEKLCDEKYLRNILHRNAERYLGVL